MNKKNMITGNADNDREVVNHLIEKANLWGMPFLKYLALFVDQEMRHKIEMHEAELLKLLPYDEVARIRHAAVTTVDRLALFEVGELARAIEHIHARRDAWFREFNDDFVKTVVMAIERECASICKGRVIKDPVQWSGLSTDQKRGLKERINEVVSRARDIAAKQLPLKGAPDVKVLREKVGSIKLEAFSARSAELDKMGYIEESVLEDDDEESVLEDDDVELLSGEELSCLKSYEKRHEEWTLLDNIFHRSLHLAKEARKKRDEEEASENFDNQ